MTDVDIISVIVPCYNASATVARSIGSILEQSYGDLEIIAVDDGSTDATWDELTKIDDRRLRIVRQSNRGVSAARNKGLAEAKGRWVAFLDADDTWHPAFLTEMHAALVTGSGAAMAYCGWQNLGLAGARSDPFVPPEYEIDGKLEVLLKGCRWPVHAVLCNAELVRSVGGFDESYITSEDYLLWLRIAGEHKIVRVPRVLAYYHHGGVQASNDSARAALDRFKVRERFLSEQAEMCRNKGRGWVRSITYGALLQDAYACYWKRDLRCARKVFRAVMAGGYGGARDWVHMLPSLLPASLHMAILNVWDHTIDMRP